MRSLASHTDTNIHTSRHTYTEHISVSRPIDRTGRFTLSERRDERVEDESGKGLAQISQWIQQIQGKRDRERRRPQQNSYRN